MGNKFHKNSAYIFLLRLFIIVIDLIGLNLILFAIQQIWRPSFLVNDLNGWSNSLLFIYNISWIILSYFFKTYQRNFHIVYNLKSSVYLFTVHLIICLVSVQLSGTKIVEPLVITTYTIFSFLFLPLSRFITHHYLNKLDNFLHIRKRVAIIGFGPLQEKLVGYFDSDESGSKLLQVLPEITKQNATVEEYFDCIQVARINQIREIYSTILPFNDETHLKIINTAEKNFIRFRFLPEIEKKSIRKIKIKNELDIPLVNYTREPLEDLDNRIRKRIFDLIVSLLVIVFLISWLWPILAIIIKLESKGPVFFRQLRSGRNNKSFVCLKFRTMVQNNEQDKIQAQKNDYRFTKIGAFLRKTNLDELPQFFNVLKGEMSVIGPRPHMLNHTKEYCDMVEYYMQRHFIKPGISGWAQVNGLRGNLNQELMEIRVRYDMHYIKNWSMWVDIDIVIKTILLTIWGDENAY